MLKFSLASVDCRQSIFCSKIWERVQANNSPAQLDARGFAAHLPTYPSRSQTSSKIETARSLQPQERHLEENWESTLATVERLRIWRVQRKSLLRTTQGSLWAVFGIFIYQMLEPCRSLVETWLRRNWQCRLKRQILYRGTWITRARRGHKVFTGTIFTHRQCSDKQCS